MIRNWIAIGAGLILLPLGASMSTGNVWAAQAAGQAAAPAAQAPAYTLAEYNAYQAAAMEQNPQMKISKLDDFVKMYPMSTLLPNAYAQYYQTYYALKNYGQTITYADKVLAIPNLDTTGQLIALDTRAKAYALGSPADKTLQTPEATTKARDAAKQSLSVLDMFAKPAQMTDDQFAQYKKGEAVIFNTIGAMTSMTLKDYAGAVSAYKAILVLNPTAAATHFQLGVAELQLSPPAADEAFWEMARAIGLKDPSLNAGQVQMYLRNQLARYQGGPACDKLVDDEVGNLIMVAGSSGDRPATLKIASAMDLDMARNDVANFLPALQMGGDTGKTMWLATCGAEYPDIPVKVMEMPMVEGDMITMKVYRPLAQDADAMQKELDAATEANMEIKIMGQPDASRVMKDSVVRFTGTLTAYSPSPFLLTFDKAKINDEDIPAPGAPPKKAPAGRRGPAAAPKKPAA